MPSAKTAHGSKTEADILTRRVCEECGVHIPQNELTTILKIVMGARGQQTDKHYETTHLPGPCGRAKAASAQAAASAAAPVVESEVTEETVEVVATETVEEVATEEAVDEAVLEPALA